MASPLIVLVACAVAVGLAGSIFIVIPLAIDNWEEYQYDSVALQQYTGNQSDVYEVVLPTEKNWYIKFTVKNTSTSHFVYPEYSGVWKMCDEMSDDARSNLTFESGKLKNMCYEFVTEYDEDNSDLTEKGEKIARMQNSAASCFIVSIIDLIAAAGVGVIAITQKQVAACLVTGVLYCMAGLFAVFGLTIFHVKTYYESYQCYSLRELHPVICEIRHLTIRWTVPVTWFGVVVCGVAFGLWIFLSRALRVIKAKTML
ncbi:hypothetical protein ScPMuIL_004034 [Solemya velum]